MTEETSFRTHSGGELPALLKALSEENSEYLK